MKEFNRQRIDQQEGIGFLTIAQGADKYILMAKNLGYSLKISNPNVKRAVVTDSDDVELHKIYHIVIPIDKSVGVGVQQKLQMFDYSPFERTIFIDCDCIVIRELDFLWRNFFGSSVNVIGSKFDNYTHWGINVAGLKAKIDINYLIRFNGGLYYFVKDSVAAQIFQTAQDLLVTYTDLGIDGFRGGINEEPLMSIAMSRAGIAPLDDEGRGMYTPIGLKGGFHIDSLTGICKFYKEQSFVEPAVVHFCGDFSKQFHYLRETAKIRSYVKAKLPRKATSYLINIAYNIPYALFIFSYRIFRLMLGRQAFKLFPLLPVYRSW
jgi:hypothetical protein